MVNYLDSRRIMGTTAERSSIPVPATQGGWVELGRTTLGSAGDSIDVTSLADKRYYMLLTYALDSGSMTPRLRLNSDTGTNYTIRGSTNGGADSTVTSADTMAMANLSGEDLFQVQYVANYATKEKLVISHTVDQVTAGASTAPSRSEFVGKHAQTSNPISAVNVVNQNAGDFASGSEVVVLGWDPADTHTNNFWEELASVDLSGGAADTLDSGTFTAKKYLFVQWYLEDSGAHNGLMRFNSDSGSNYATRYSTNGSSDSTIAPSSSINFATYGASVPSLSYAFIINNQSNEKLALGGVVSQGTAGAANAPNRREGVGKWANTSTQITSIQIVNNDSGDFGTKSIMKVWGAD